MLKMGTKNIIQICYHFTSYIFNSSYRLEGKFVKPGKKYSGNIFRASLGILASTEKDFKLDEKKKETV